MPVLKIWDGSAWVPAGATAGVATATAPLVVTGANMTINAATTSAAGSLSAADKTKLNALAAPVQRLGYAPGADLFSGTAITAATWTDLHANQSFTVGSVTAWLLVEVRLGLLATTATGQPSITARILYNSAGTPVDRVFASSVVSPAGSFAALSGNAFWLPAGTLPAGTNTAKVQVYGNGAWTAYCRAITQPNVEFFALRIVEISA